MNKRVLKPISELPAGTKFSFTYSENAQAVISNTSIEEGFIKVREILGGKGYASQWLGQEQNCHADIDVLVNPAHLDEPIAEEANPLEGGMAHFHE